MSGRAARRAALAALGLAVLCGAAAPALAQSTRLVTPPAPPLVRPCDQREIIEDLAEPWEQFSDTLANGAVRIAVIDRGEPAVAAMHLLVLTPPADQAGTRVCRVVSLAEGAGFGSIDFTERGTAYDAAKGLLFDVPVRYHDPVTGEQTPAQLSVTIRQNDGGVTARLLR